MSNERPVRGEVWDVDLDPVLGHEQGRKRPALAVSVNEFNQGPSSLLQVVPITSRDRGVRSRIAIETGEAGLKTRSFAMSEALRSISARADDSTTWNGLAGRPWHGSQIMKPPREFGSGRRGETAVRYWIPTDRLSRAPAGRPVSGARTDR